MTWDELSVITTVYSPILLYIAILYLIKYIDLINSILNIGIQMHIFPL